MSGFAGMQGLFAAQMAPTFSATPMGVNIAGVTPMVGAPSPVPATGSPPIGASVNPKVAQGAGAIIAIFGSINSAIGTYYAAESQKSQLKQQAAAQRFASSMARINARGAEFAAQQTLLAGGREMGRVGMAMGQRRAATAASIAARGGQAGVGSNREIVASLDLVSEIDRLTMDANRIRQAEALRTQAVNYQTQAVMGGVSADNLNTTAGTISPGLGAFTSLMGSAGSLASTWAQNRRFEDMLAALQEGRR